MKSQCLKCAFSKVWFNKPWSRACLGESWKFRKQMVGGEKCLRKANRNVVSYMLGTFIWTHHRCPRVKPFTGAWTATHTEVHRCSQGDWWVWESEVPVLGLLLASGLTCPLAVEEKNSHVTLRTLTDTPLLFSRLVLSDSVQPHGLQHTRPSVLHFLPEFAQIHVHWVGDAI